MQFDVGHCCMGQCCVGEDSNMAVRVKVRRDLNGVT